MDYHEHGEVRRKLRILNAVKLLKTCVFGARRANFDPWRTVFNNSGEAGLRNHRSVPHAPPNKTKPEVEFISAAKMISVQNE